jgi:hypothetical protein
MWTIRRLTPNSWRGAYEESPMKKLWRWLLAALLVVVALGLAAPRVSADRFRPRIQAALQAALDRPVHLGAVHWNLFTGPGFTVDDVLIDDELSAGIEPFAHVESMQARIRWTSLFSGNLEFSSLRLDAPNVNVVKTAPGPWNIQPLLDHEPRTGTAPRRVPDIQIRGGRIDFKFGDTKSLFYISDADVDVYPDDNGEVVIRFSGAPARTDQASQSFGELSARGLLKPGAAGEHQLSMGVHLDRTPISEITRLFHGSDLGVHGYVVANARLAGPLSHLDLTGDLNVSDVHRWDLMPAPGEGWALNYRGLLNLTGHHLELASAETPGQPDPVAVAFRLDDYLAAPKWSGNLQFRNLPAASLVETARHFGAPLPPGVQVEGQVEGEIGYSSESGAGGSVALSSASVKFPQDGEGQVHSLRIASAQLEISKGNVVLAPADIEMQNGHSAMIEGEYALDNSHRTFRISAGQLAAADTRLFPTEPIPLLDELQQGSWKGWVAYEKTGQDPGVWSGQYDLQNAAIEVPGLASTVRLAAATVAMDAGEIQITRLRGHAGPVKFEGEYRYDASAARPHRLHLTIAELQLGDIESLLMPALRRNEGFLARAFRRDQRIPKWLEERNAELNVQISSVLAGDAALGALTARAVWHGPSISVGNLDWRWDAMHATGKASINLAKAEPVYEVSGSVENLDYRNGRLDIDGQLHSSGIGADVLANLRSKGTFEGHGILLGPDADMREVSGAYTVSASSGVPWLLLSNVQVVQGSDTLVGQGSSQPDGHIVLELASGRKQVRLTGMLLPVHPDPAPAR